MEVLVEGNPDKYWVDCDHCGSRLGYTKDDFVYRAEKPPPAPPNGFTDGEVFIIRTITCPVCDEEIQRTSKRYFWIKEDFDESKLENPEFIEEEYGLSDEDLEEVKQKMDELEGD